jgi:hypothetical protein
MPLGKRRNASRIPDDVALGWRVAEDSQCVIMWLPLLSGGTLRGSLRAPTLGCSRVSKRVRDRADRLRP